MEEEEVEEKEIPDRPDSVCSCAPIASASFLISERPRVTRAAAELYPMPQPSAMPQAIANTFLSAPPTSTPIGSFINEPRCGSITSIMYHTYDVLARVDAHAVGAEQRLDCSRRCHTSRIKTVNPYIITPESCENTVVTYAPSGRRMSRRTLFSTGYKKKLGV